MNCKVRIRFQLGCGVLRDRVVFKSVSFHSVCCAFVVLVFVGFWSHCGPCRVGLVRVPVYWCSHAQVGITFLFVLHARVLSVVYMVRFCFQDPVFACR